MQKGVRTLIWVATLLAADLAYAQSGMLESLQRLDRNENGQIEPEEITPLSRPFMERIAQARRMSLERPYSIDSWREAARIYFALQNGVDDKRIRPTRIDGGVQSFEPSEEEPLIPEFGIGEAKYAYTRDDLQEADDTLRRYDRDRDGFLDRGEAIRARWTHRDPFEADVDGDDRLSRMELAQRYARRRLLDQQKNELVKKAWRTGSGVQSWEKPESERETSSNSWQGRDSSSYLTSMVMGRLDANRNGRLEDVEAAKLGVPLGRIDEDRDGELSRQEVNAYLEGLQQMTGDSEVELPAWFYELDVDHDEQLVLTEFATQLSEQRIDEFNAYDTNGDGILTKAEIVQSRALVGGSYRNESAVILPPRRTVVSEIVISEDYLIGDVNVEVSITHTSVGYLDAFLVGPAGQRVELFTAVGGSGDHFDQTVFDDRSRYPITKARPPFKGSYQPEALAKRQPSLTQFNGTNVQGTWQLVIECSRSERFGMLNTWGLQIRPSDEMPSDELPTAESAAAATPAAISPQPSSMMASVGQDAQRRGDDVKQAMREEKKAAVDSTRAYYEKLKAETFEAATRENRPPTAEELAAWKTKLTELAQTKKLLKKAEKAESGKISRPPLDSPSR